MKSLLYRSPTLYNLVLGLVHGRALRRRYEAAASEIKAGESVFDLGCGTGMLYGRLGKSCRYVGWDANPAFVRHCRSRGIAAYERDIFGEGYPEADVTVVCDILHHVCPRDRLLLEKALGNSRRVVAIEPYRPYRIPLPKPLLKAYDAVLGDSDGINRFEDRIKWDYTPEGLVEYFRSFGECRTSKINLDVMAVYDRSR